MVYEFFFMFWNEECNEINFNRLFLIGALSICVDITLGTNRVCNNEEYYHAYHDQLRRYELSYDRCAREELETISLNCHHQANKTLIFWGKWIKEENLLELWVKKLKFLTKTPGDSNTLIYFLYHLHYKLSYNIL